MKKPNILVHMKKWAKMKAKEAHESKMHALQDGGKTVLHFHMCEMRSFG